MQFEDAIGQRAELALELLTEGEPVSFRGLQLQLTDSDTVECRVFSQWSPENVNRAIAVGEIDNGRRTLSDLVAGSPSYRSLLESRRQFWELLFDYGQGAIRLCSVRNETLTWDAGFPKRQ